MGFLKRGITLISAKVRLRLLNGGYSGLGDVTFPVVVPAKQSTYGTCKVDGKDLISIGGSPSWFDLVWNYNFSIGSDCEVISE